MRSGVGDLLDVIDTCQTLLSAEIDLADRRYERLDAIGRLYRALGGGWRP